MLLHRAQSEGLPLRALGGVGIALSCPSALTQPLAREFSDLDLAVPSRGAAKASQLIEASGFAPAREFNAVHGGRRQMFDRGDLHIDLFVDRFAMCHEVPFSWTGGPDRVTLDPTELLLTKLQIVELTGKDVADVAALVLDHGTWATVDPLDNERIAELFARDWGWWRTGTRALSALVELLPSVLTGADLLERAVAQLTSLQAAIDAAPKSLRWRARARIGERLPWFEEPEATGSA